MKLLYTMILLFCSFSVFADKVLLKTGEVLVGKIWVSDENYIWMEGVNGVYKIARYTVSKVEPNEMVGRKLKLTLTDGTVASGRFWSWNSELVEIGSETGQDLVRYPWNSIQQLNFLDNSP